MLKSQMTLLKRSFIGFTTYMAVYGFSRGYRSEFAYGNIDKLTTDRIRSGILNGLIYSAFPFNIYQISRLLNRIEIESKGLNKNDYPEEFREITGECYYTF